MTAPPTPSRRERLRAQTLEEIRQHGYAQIAGGGPAALSLNGIAKTMGMSGPALYRYFPSRDALLTTLISESYESLTAALTDALAAAHRRGAEGRVQAVADAYRGWALAQPHRYRLVFQSALSADFADPERIIPAAQRAMDVFLEVLSGLEPAPTSVSPAALASDLRRWGARSGQPGSDPSLYLLALTTWSRLHGVISLEIEGIYAQMEVDPGVLYAAEVRTLIAAAG